MNVVRTLLLLEALESDGWILLCSGERCYLLPERWRGGAMMLEVKEKEFGHWKTVTRVLSKGSMTASQFHNGPSPFFISFPYYPISSGRQP